MVTVSIKYGVQGRVYIECDPHMAHSLICRELESTAKRGSKRQWTQAIRNA